jgi:hypothetical protein
VRRAPPPLLVYCLLAVSGCSTLRSGYEREPSPEPLRVERALPRDPQLRGYLGLPEGDPGSPRAETFWRAYHYGGEPGPKRYRYDADRRAYVLDLGGGRVRVIAEDPDAEPEPVTAPEAWDAFRRDLERALEQLHPEQRSEEPAPGAELMPAP